MYMASVEILDIFLEHGLVGKLCRFDSGATTPVTRFIAKTSLKY